MSLRQNQNFQFWKEVEVSLRSINFTCSGDRLVEDDRTTVSQVFTLWCLVIQDLCGASRLRSNAALRAWLFQVGKYPLHLTVETLKQVASFMRDYSRDMGEPLCYESFKQTQLGQEVLVRLLLKPIADLCDCFLRECHSTMLQALLTCLEFPCRMTLNVLPSVFRKEKQAYLDLEREMQGWEYPEDLLVELEDEIRALFVEWPGFTFFPQHGNGAVSDTKGTDATAKYTVLLERGLPPRLHHYFCQHRIEHPLANMKCVDSGSPCRVLLVPKGCSSKRVISAEPTANQWFQQALRRDLAEYLPSSCFHITMEDQSRNQALAQVGSLYRNYGTIDLSSASDTVTNRLVKRIFRSSPIRDELWSCRTRTATLDGQLITLEKFAPMGSSVCFPIENIVFAAVVRVAQKHVGVNHDYVVYGDDIICHLSAFQEVVRLLGLLHFRVNERKTFWPDSPFKESCGKEYYYGDDVTPMRIPRFFHGWKDVRALRQAPQLLPGWVSLANRLANAGLDRARSYLVKRLLELCPSVLFSETDEFLAIQSHCATNFHVPDRWEGETSSLDKQRKNLCRGRLVKGMTLFARTSPGDDNIRYQMLLEQYVHTTRQALLAPDDLIQLEAGPTQLMARPRWVAERELTRCIVHRGILPALDHTVQPAIKRSSRYEFQLEPGETPEWRMRTVL